MNIQITNTGYLPHALLDELTKKRTEEKFPVLSIVEPVTTRVEKFSKKLFDDTQTPTLKVDFESNVYLPSFRRTIAITPQIIETPTIEQPQNVVELPKIDITNKRQEKAKMVEDLVAFVTNTEKLDTPSIQTTYDRFIWSIINDLKQAWEAIFQSMMATRKIFPKRSKKWKQSHCS